MFDLTWLRQWWPSSATRQPHVGVIEQEPLREWRIFLSPGRTFIVRANTKSEARARVKELLGVERLPIGAVCESECLAG